MFHDPDRCRVLLAGRPAPDRYELKTLRSQAAANQARSQSVPDPLPERVSVFLGDARIVPLIWVFGDLAGLSVLRARNPQVHVHV